MNRHRWIAAAALGLLAAVLAMRHCRRTPPHPEPLPARIAIPRPSPPPPLPFPEPPPVVASAPEPPRRDLVPWLERLGRARLLRDIRTLERLRTEVPSLHDGDVPGLIALLRSDLFAAAGAAELIRWYRISRAVPELSEALRRDSHPFLKGIVIDALASIGGDPAAAALVAGLGQDPDPGVRARCASALGSIETIEAYQALAAAVRDPIPAIRSAAADALRRMKSQQTVEILLSALQAENDPQVQADLAVGIYAAGGESVLAALRQILESRPDTASVLDHRSRLRDPARYSAPFARRFFEPGQPPVPWDPARRRIGITVGLGEGVTLQDAASGIFASSPFDRYRAWFHFRRAEEFPSARAYDSYGNPMGDVPYDGMDGTVYLYFRDPESFKPGVLGFAEGSKATVQPVSLLHEIGHAFARLGDEYAGGSKGEAANLVRPGAVPWKPLIDAGHLGPPARRDEAFLIPSEDCHLGNRLSASRFCPVCQIEIVARLCELTGAPLPW